MSDHFGTLCIKELSYSEICLEYEDYFLVPSSIKNKFINLLIKSGNEVPCNYSRVASVPGITNTYCELHLSQKTILVS